MGKTHQQIVRSNHVYEIHHDWLGRIAWSPNGNLIAFTAGNGDAAIWDIEAQKVITKLLFGKSGVDQPTDIAWSSSKKAIAVASHGINVVELYPNRQVRAKKPSKSSVGPTALSWNPRGNKLAYSMDNFLHVTGNKARASFYGGAKSIQYSRDGRVISAANHNQVVFFDAHTLAVISELDFETGINDLVWLRAENQFATALDSRMVKIHDAVHGRTLTILEGHTSRVLNVALSYDGKLLASKSSNGQILLWDTAEWRLIHELQMEESPSTLWVSGFKFSPNDYTLAATGGSLLRLIEFDRNQIAKMKGDNDALQYTNAKVVLVGDTGVGKSGLAHVLTDRPFVATTSTHGRNVWMFNKEVIQVSREKQELRETLLWDLAGQPGYRLVHQLHLNEVAVALVVFDSRSETDPFAGVRHWEKALRQAQLLRDGENSSFVKILVAARVDRGSIGVSNKRIEKYVSDLQFDGYIETSAKENWNIKELQQKIKDSIQWDTLPKVVSTELFVVIKDFIQRIKLQGHTLLTVDNLFRLFVDDLSRFINQKDISEIGNSALKEQFETCVRLVESRDLIKQLNFGSLILLQPEYLDAYASAIIYAAKDEPDGLGTIPETYAQTGRFKMSSDERVHDRTQEKLLLLATVEDLLLHEIAIREVVDDGAYLVFPSQFTREHPNLPEPEGRAVSFEFEGALLNIYTTLAVRLSHSGIFSRNEMWKNASSYMDMDNNQCGMFLKLIEEGRGKIVVFFDDATSVTSRRQFIQYIRSHIQRNCVRGSFATEVAHRCSECGFIVPSQLVKIAKDMNSSVINCPVPNCGNAIHLQEDPGPNHDDLGLVSRIDSQADKSRHASARESLLQGKIKTNNFDVFLAHSSADKRSVRRISRALKQRGIYPWLDADNLPPGILFQDGLEEAISSVKSAAIIIGPQGVGRWQVIEMKAFISQFVERSLPVIPVLLPGVTQIPQELRFLSEFNFVRFEQEVEENDALDSLEWGITGRRPANV